MEATRETHVGTISTCIRKVITMGAEGLRLVASAKAHGFDVVVGEVDPLPQLCHS
jgi:hypothetical protein